MHERIAYVAAAILVGAAVTLLLRALPFVLFAGRAHSLPRGVEKFGAIVSPVIIACLVVYSYLTLKLGDGSAAWKSPWPYLAGAFTVGVHLWKKNPLASILAGTVLYMVLVGCCGCSSIEAEYRQDRAHPLLSVTPNGLKFMDDYVTPSEAVERLENAGIPKSDTIYVLIDDENADHRALWVFRQNYLSRAGYTRSAWVTPRRAESGSAEQLDSRLEKRKIPFAGRTISNDGRNRSWHLTEDPDYVAPAESIDRRKR
ncbi:MAG: AzlD domain-containing protein [Kiritimatiellae bacterium]|nr:AzlD domain-containing protein [Kiritimatiellia bacterium]